MVARVVADPVAEACRVDTVARAEEIGANLRAAAERIGLPPTAIGVVSRGDSTLRGHYPHETDALASGLGTPDTATLLAPFFFEGGRLTAYDQHYVAAADGSVEVKVPPSLQPGQSFKIAIDDEYGEPRSYRVRVPDDHVAGRPLRVPLWVAPALPTPQEYTDQCPRPFAVTLSTGVTAQQNGGRHADTRQSTGYANPRRSLQAGRSGRTNIARRQFAGTSGSEHMYANKTDGDDQQGGLPADAF